MYGMMFYVTFYSTMVILKQQCIRKNVTKYTLKNLFQFSNQNEKEKAVITRKFIQQRIIWFTSPHTFENVLYVEFEETVL